MSVTHHDRALQLIERLEPYALGLDRFFFATSGAEAVEGALRLARQATNRSGVIAFRGGYHGRTAGTLAITTSGIGYRGGNAGPLPWLRWSSFEGVRGKRPARADGRRARGVSADSSVDRE